MSSRSWKIHLVVDKDYECSTPVRAYSLKWRAEAKAAAITESNRQKGLVAWGDVITIDLVTHDGAHALHEALIANTRKGGKPHSAAGIGTTGATPAPATLPPAKGKRPRGAAAGGAHKASATMPRPPATR